MSTPEHEGQPAEQKSSVEISTNAKQESQVRVKVYDGATQEALDVLRAIAVATYRATVSAVRNA